MLENRKNWMGYLCMCVACFCSSFIGVPTKQEGVFKWGLPKTFYKQNSSSNERFIFSLLQETLRCKIEKSFQEMGISYELDLEQGFLPCQFACLFNPEELHKVQELRTLLEARDISLLEEFEAVKTVWHSWILDSRSESMAYFEKVLQELSFEDLVAAFKRIEAEESSIDFDRERNNASFRPLLASKSTFIPVQKGWEPAPGEGIGGVPKSEEAKLFFDLPLTDKDKVTTRKLITNMADKNVLQLLMDRKSMERKGDEVRPIHPLKFIGFILADPNLNRCMKSVSKTSFKWSSFVEGFEKRMKEENKAGNLNRYIPGFADYMEVDKGVVQNYINQGNYEGLIKYFL